MITYQKFIITVKTKYIFLDLLFDLFKFQMQKVQKMKKKVNSFLQQRVNGETKRRTKNKVMNKTEATKI